MFKKLFGKSSTTKFDVVMAGAAAIIAVWKAIDTVRDYQTEKEEEK